MLNEKNNTNFAQNPQGNSAGIQIYNDKDTEAEKLPKQYGKMPFGITPHLTKLSAKALLLYVDMSQLFWGESNSLSLTTNPITDDGLAKRTGFSLAKTAHARRELVDSGVVEVVKTAHADSGKLKRVFRFYQVGEIGGGEPQPEQTSASQIANAKNGALETGDSQMTNVTSESPETASSDGAPEASNSSNRTEACVQSEQHHVFKMNNTMCSKRTNPNQEKKSAKPDGGSVSETEGQEPLLVLPTSNNYYYNYYNPNDSISQVENMLENGGEEELQRLQQTYWQTSDKDRMKGTLAELHAHIMQKFDFPSNYAFRLLEDVSKDKGETLYPQGYMSNPDSMAHLAKIAKPLQRELREQVKQEQAKREEAKREEAKQQRKLELEQREAIFQGLGPEFDKDVQNTLKGVIMDSSVYYGALGKEKPLESKIDTFLSNSEGIIKPLYDKHVKASLDTDGVVEEEEALKERLRVMWDWNQVGTRLGDFCDFIKRMILSDEQLQSPFTLDDDTKPQPRDTVVSQMAQQSTKPPASVRTKAKCYTPREKLTLVEGGQFNEGLKQELITQGLIELEADTIGTWANSMAISNMLVDAGMTSKELVEEVLSQAGDKPSESVAGVSNDTVQQDAPSEAEEDKPSQQDAQNSATVQDATAEAQLSLF